MSDGAATLATPLVDAPALGGEAPARPLVESQIEALGELVDIGLKLARAIERQVDADVPRSIADLNAAAIAFARVARAVRQTVMLQNKLRAEATAAKAKAGDVRVRVSRIVRQAIEDEHDDPEQVERLAAEAAEGLEQERWGDLLARPVAEIVADICKALGLEPDWPALESDIAAAEAFARSDAGNAEDMNAEDMYAGPIEVRWIGEDDEPPNTS